MKHVFLSMCVAVFLLFPHIAQCQNFRIPEHYSFENIDSYHKYDKDIIKFTKWIEKIAPGDDNNNVKRATRFFMEWETGCPYVRFSQNVRIDAFLADAPEYKIYYIAGWVRYALESEGKSDKMMCTYSGIKTVLKVYKQNREQKRDANLDDLLKLDEESKLRMWVQEKLN
jgi:hypothetical protein